MKYRLIKRMGEFGFNGATGGCISNHIYDIYNELNEKFCDGGFFPDNAHKYLMKFKGITKEQSVQIVSIAFKNGHADFESPQVKSFWAEPRFWRKTTDVVWKKAS